MEITSDNIYEPIQEVQSIVGNLMETIYNDESYQEYLSDLKNSTDNTKKLDNIAKTFTDIKVFNTNQDPLFLASDIGIILGASNVNTMIKNYSNTEKINGIIIINGKPIKKIFLTKHGVYRIMFNNRSKLSELFRAFIYKLLDYMENKGREISKELMAEVSIENPELVHEAIAEYKNNLQRYKHLYELECNSRKMLELTVEELEFDKKELTITQTYNNLYIKKLRDERHVIIDKLYNIKEETDIDDRFEALEIMKKKYFKEFTISLVKPEIVSNLFDKKNSQYKVPKDDYIYNQYIDDFDFLIKSIEMNSKINEDEIYYLSIALKSPIKKDTTKNNDIYVASDYVCDKVKFAELQELLKKDHDHYLYPGHRKDYIYKISISDIRLVVKDMILNSLEN